MTAIMDLAQRVPDALPLAAFPDTDREDLARGMRFRRFRAGEVIYHRGDVAAHANVVHEGLVKVVLFDDDGRVALVGLHGPGELFGELALFTDAPRDASVIAVVPTIVLQITRDAYWRILQRSPRAVEWMFGHLGRTIQRLEQQYESIVFEDVPGRLARYLLELDAEGTAHPITQDDLAAAIGSTRVTVNKLLADLERRGLITVDRRRIEVLDRDALAKESRR